MNRHVQRSTFNVQRCQLWTALIQTLQPSARQLLWILQFYGGNQHVTLTDIQLWTFPGHIKL